MAGWKANIGAHRAQPGLLARRLAAIDPRLSPPPSTTRFTWAEEAGLDVILDLHWSDQGVLGSCVSANRTHTCQQVMADANSITFWSEVASRYTRVTGASCSSSTTSRTTSPGTSGSRAAVSARVPGRRNAAALRRRARRRRRQPGGDRRPVLGLRLCAACRRTAISGYNILYATHPYNDSADEQAGRLRRGLGLPHQDRSGDRHRVRRRRRVQRRSMPYVPAINTYVSAVITYADQHSASWTAWAWYPGGCTFPSLISDWNGTPTPPGAIVTDARSPATASRAPDGKRDAGARPDAASAGGAAGAGDARGEARRSPAATAGTPGADGGSAGRRQRARGLGPSVQRGAGGAAAPGCCSPR